MPHLAPKWDLEVVSWKFAGQPREGFVEMKQEETSNTHIAKRASRFILTALLFLAAAGSAAGQSRHGDEADFYADDPRLEAWVHQALDANPSILEALARYRSALQKVPQVTSLPDPMLTYTQFVRSPETRVGPQLQSFMLTQRFPWFGKLDLRGQVSLKQAAALYRDFQAREREVVAQVKSAYYDLLYVDQAVVVTGQEKALLEQYEGLAQARYSSGQGLQQNVIKIQAEITKIMNRLLMLARQRESLTARLNTLADRAPESRVETTVWPALPQVSFQLDDLYRTGERNRQELRAAETRVEAAEKSVQLAEKSFWPEFTLGAGMINVGDRHDPAGVLMPPLDNGKNAYSFTIGLNIPLRRDRYRAEISEATENLIVRRKGYLNLRNEVEFAIRDQVIQAQTLVEQMELFERVLIPQSEEALRSSEAAYQTGQAGALDLLDSERVLLEVRLVNIRYRADFLKALAAVERALGTRFPQ